MAGCRRDLDGSSYGALLTWLHDSDACYNSCWTGRLLLASCLHTTCLVPVKLMFIVCGNCVKGYCALLACLLPGAGNGRHCRLGSKQALSR
jgi:hypothetical protein